MAYVFLGQSVPFDDLQVSQVNSKRCGLQYPAESQAQEYVERIVRTFGGTDVEFHLAGSVFKDAESAPGVSIDVARKFGSTIVLRISRFYV